MRLIKLAIISIVIFFLIITAFSLMIPSRVRISRAINLHGNSDSIFSLLANRDRWKEWHPAFMPSDSSGPVPPVRTVLQVQNDSQLVMQLHIGNQDPVINGWQIYRYQDVDSVTLQWYMDFQLKWYPWKKFSSLLYESTYGNMMQDGLQNIKNLNGE